MARPRSRPHRKRQLRRSRPRHGSRPGEARNGHSRQWTLPRSCFQSARARRKCSTKNSNRTRVRAPIRGQLLQALRQACSGPSSGAAWAHVLSGSRPRSTTRHHRRRPRAARRPNAWRSSSRSSRRRMPLRRKWVVCIAQTSSRRSRASRRGGRAYCGGCTRAGCHPRRRGVHPRRCRTSRHRRRSRPARARAHARDSAAAPWDIGAARAFARRTQARIGSVDDRAACSWRRRSAGAPTCCGATTAAAPVAAPQTPPRR